MTEIAQFEPFASSLETAFWQRLIQLKIDVLKLDDKAVPIHGSYARGKSFKDRETDQWIRLGSLLQFDANAYDVESAAGQSFGEPSVTLKGHLRNFNTVEDFKKTDKQALFDDVVKSIWNAITQAPAPTLQDLNPLLLLTFADLKKFKFFYMFAFPALLPSSPWKHQDSCDLSPELHARLAPVYAQYLQKAEQAGCGLVKYSGADDVEIGSLGDFKTLYKAAEAVEPTLIFLDPSNHPAAAGWPLRNVLAYLSVRFGVTKVKVICWRDGSALDGKQEPQSKVVTYIEGQYGDGQAPPKAIGWEKNQANKVGSRLADLGPIMDPTRLADQAVDLNLKLMRWRIMPELDLDRIKETKCLLLGAGTLGCYVARNLLGWGVRNITFLDSAKVSYSNPVRQPLFDFEDCLEGGKPKAAAAAAALKRIYPGVNANGLQLSIPMPGHPIPPALLEQSKADVRQLEQLVADHDVIYLLMDSRESRWLPTVLGMSKGKLVMNAALGFDTYLVMRHGVASSDPTTASTTLDPAATYKGKLGCYFCNDIVAPTDSLSDRTLDQMCTVTRPGLAAIASATAVELMVSVLQHPQGISAPAESPNTDPSDAPCVLGLVPHQIRGYLAKFENLKILGRAYDRCTGCSDHIVNAYETKGFEFLVEAFNDAQYLEKVTGLDKLQAESEAALEDIDWDVEDEEESV